MTNTAQREARERPSAAAWFLVLLLHGYRRFISPLLGPRGAAYFTGDPVRTALIPAEGMALSEGDPTGCGDVLGATVAASLAAGTGLEEALRLGTRMGARNVTHRGATGLRDHLLGRLSAV